MLHIPFPLIILAAGLAMFRFKLGMLPTLAVCGVAGMVLAALG
ncbi:hypothetical protein [Xanthobacter flavus]